MTEQQHTEGPVLERGHDYELDIWRFRLRLKGPAATNIATSGTFMIAGYCFYKVLNDPQLLSCILHGITGGSVVMDFAIENEEVVNQAFPFFNSKKLVDMFNAELENYPRQLDPKIGKFVSANLECNQGKINKTELLDLKKKAVDLKKEYEEELHFAFERSTFEEEITTTTVTKVKRTKVDETYTASKKSSTRSTQQQVLSPEVRAKVEATKPEAAATEASEQTTTETESSQQASSTSTEAEKPSAVTDSYDIDVEQAKGFAIGTRSKVHARSSPQTTVGESTREKKRSAKKRTSTPNREDKETPSKKRRSFKVRMGTAQGFAIGDDSTVEFEEST